MPVTTVERFAFPCISQKERLYWICVNTGFQTFQQQLDEMTPIYVLFIHAGVTHYLRLPYHHLSLRPFS